MTTEQIIKELRDKVYKYNQRPGAIHAITKDMQDELEAFLISTLEDVAKELEGIKGIRIVALRRIDAVNAYNVAIDGCNEKLDQLITSLREKGA